MACTRSSREWSPITPQSHRKASSSSLMVAVCHNTALTPLQCKSWKTDSIVPRKPRKCTSFLLNTSKGLMFLHHMISCKPHKSRWTIAGGYGEESYFLTLIANKDKYLNRSSALVVSNTFSDYLSATRVFRSFSQSVNTFKAHCSFLVVFLGRMPSALARRFAKVGFPNLEAARPTFQLPMSHFGFFFSCLKSNLSSESLYFPMPISNLHFCPDVVMSFSEGTFPSLIWTLVPVARKHPSNDLYSPVTAPAAR